MTAAWRPRVGAGHIVTVNAACGGGLDIDGVHASARASTQFVSAPCQVVAAERTEHVPDDPASAAMVERVVVVLGDKAHIDEPVGRLGDLLAARSPGSKWARTSGPTAGHPPLDRIGLFVGPPES